MNISKPTISLFRRYKPQILAAVLSFTPMKTGKIQQMTFNTDTFIREKIELVNLTKDLKKIKTINFRGGVTETFDEASLEVLRKRILKPQDEISYCFPLKGADRIYTEPFGEFLAPRPGGRNHLGLDIFTTPYAKKPQNPVTIVAPVDGVVVANKYARSYDNVIANKIEILGIDGRKYIFDHMARGNEYPDSIARPELGTFVTMGTPLGYVGSTGETTMYHLHFSVQTQEQLKKQLQSDIWLERQKKSPYSELKGQVNPRDSEEAGPIADELNKVLK